MRRLAVRWWSIGALGAVLLAGVRPARADTWVPGVALGVGLGAAIPSGQVMENGTFKGVSPSFGWGFYVNIPLISTFHIMPHAELYNVSPNVTAADIGLAFKFVVPTPFVQPYFGVSVGDTDLISQHINVGGLVGASVHLIANVDAFIEGRYVAVLTNTDDVQNIRTIHALAGALFRF